MCPVARGKDIHVDTESYGGRTVGEWRDVVLINVRKNAIFLIVVERYGFHRPRRPGCLSILDSATPTAYITRGGPANDGTSLFLVQKIVPSFFRRILNWLKTHMGEEDDAPQQNTFYTYQWRKFWQRGTKAKLPWHFLDMNGAFDNVAHERILLNLKKKRIDKRVVTWVKSLLSNRT